jgi:hypothetical protein
MAIRHASDTGAARSRVRSTFVPCRIAVACGVIALTVGGTAVVARLSSVDWSVTGLPRVAAGSGLGRLARRIDPDFQTVRRGAYDGPFYWGIAIDPLAGGGAHRFFDKASYRYGHPLDGWAGWLVAGGAPAAAPGALLCIGLLSLAGAAASASALALGSISKWVAGLCVALNPGLIFAVVADLGEPLAALALLAALYALSTRRIWPSWLCLAVLPLAKEELIVVLAAAAVYRLAERRPREAALLMSAVVPALAWWTFARIRLGGWFTSGTTALGPPFVGWRAAFHEPAASVFLALLLGLLIIATARALRRRGLVDLVYLALASVATCLAPNATTAFTTALRNTAFLTALLPLVLGGGSSQLASTAAA